jgi:hypothetical protein
MNKTTGVELLTSQRCSACRTPTSCLESSPRVKNILALHVERISDTQARFQIPDTAAKLKSSRCTLDEACGALEPRIGGRGNFIPAT